MSDEVKIRDSVSFRPSHSAQIHDLVMLYLKNQDLNKLSISEIAQKYTDTEDEFIKAFREQRQNKTYYA